MNKKRDNKRGQITIFVIIALIIVVSIALVYTLVGGTKIIGTSPATSPQAYIEGCAENAIKEAVEIMNPQAGFINPDTTEEKSIFYDEKDVGYLCYTNENNVLCTNQEPMLVNHIEQEIKDYISPRIDSCFEDVRDSLSKYEYDEKNTGELEVDIKSKQIIAKINKEISYVRAGQKNIINNFNAEVNNAMWDFLKITNKIINQELTCDCLKGTCNADIVALSLGNPRFEVGKFVTGEGEEIYNIKEIKTEDKFVFAIRNCVREIEFNEI